MLLANEICSLGLTMMNSSNRRCYEGPKSFDDFRHIYTLSPEQFVSVWDLLDINEPLADPKQLMWTLLYLKGYNTHKHYSVLLGIDGKTFRKWTKIFIEKLSKMGMVRRIQYQHMVYCCVLISFL